MQCMQFGSRKTTCIICWYVSSKNRGKSRCFILKDLIQTRPYLSSGQSKKPRHTDTHFLLIAQNRDSDPGSSHYRLNHTPSQCFRNSISRNKSRVSGLSLSRKLEIIRNYSKSAPSSVTRYTRGVSRLSFHVSFADSEVLKKGSWPVYKIIRIVFPLRSDIILSSELSSPANKTESIFIEHGTASCYRYLLHVWAYRQE